MESDQDIICWMPVRSFLDVFLPTPLNHKPSVCSREKPMFGLGNAFQSDSKDEEQSLYWKLMNVLAENLRHYGFQRPGVSLEGDWCCDIASHLEQHASHAKGDPLPELDHTVIMQDFGRDKTDTEMPRCSNDSERLWRCKEARRTLQRISADIAKVLNHQHRTHAFHVVFTPSMARLLRMDRSGLVISEPILICEDASDLFEFYERYACAPLDMRGHDLTVQPATDDEIAVAKPILEKWVPSCFRTHPFYVFSVPNVDGHFRRVIAWAPLNITDSLAGRATRPYPVYDIESKQVLFLKDYWRECSAEYARESDILRELNENGVEHVPILLAGDDVPGQYHRTSTHQFNSAPWRTGTASKLIPRIHHRILEDFLPQSIDAFRTPHDMLQLAHHALTGHQQAYERCQILHRDVSTNNIRIRGDGEGVLADWDLAIKLGNQRSDQSLERNRPHRVGTWKFLSAALALKPSRENTFQDDLESFYWVILHLSLTYLPFTTRGGAPYSEIIKNIFDDRCPGMENSIGGYHKRAIMEGDSYARDLVFAGNDALTSWFHTASDIFEMLYAYRNNERQRSEKRRRVPPPPPIDRPSETEDHKFLIGLTANVLSKEEWSDNKTNNRHPSKDVCSNSSGRPSSGCCGPIPVAQVQKREASSRKRQRDHEDEDRASSSKRTRLEDDDGVSPDAQTQASLTRGAKPSIRVVPEAHSAQDEAAVSPSVSEKKHIQPRRSSRLKRTVDDDKIVVPQPKAGAKVKAREPPPKFAMTLRSAVKEGSVSNPTPAASKQSTKPKGATTNGPQLSSKFGKCRGEGTKRARSTTRQAAIAAANAAQVKAPAKRGVKTTTARKSKRKH